MRIWSLHPKYLDRKGLLAVWRETLLARHVLEGKTKGYRNHPQLNRFKALDNPLDGIDCYLQEIFHEASSRGYAFDKSKFMHGSRFVRMPVTTGQMQFERMHLLQKLQVRDPGKYAALCREKDFIPHPIFWIVEGPVEDWEKV